MTESIYVALGLRDRELREQAGWTQSDLACQVGLSRTSITNIEIGRQRTMLHHVELLADVFGLTVGDLLELKPSAPNELVDLRRKLSRAEAECSRLQGVVSEIARLAK